MSQRINSVIRRLRAGFAWAIQKRWPALAAVILLGGIVALAIYLWPQDQPLAPTHNVVIPQSKSVEELGGWQRVSPPDSDPVFAYSDQVDEIDISVSQQPIPQSFANNTSERVKELAESYSATTTFKAGDIDVYIGRSSKGPQSLIFVRDGLLVLIKSQDTLDQKTWTNYIVNLHDPDAQIIPSF